jgi:hypothetical protein
MTFDFLYVRVIHCLSSFTILHDTAESQTNQSILQMSLLFKFIKYHSHQFISIFLTFGLIHRLLVNEKIVDCNPHISDG